MTILALLKQFARGLPALALAGGLATGSIGLDGCGTTGGNPAVASQVSVSFGTYTAMQRQWYDFLVPSAYAAVSNVKFCFQRIRFKSAAGSADNDNVDLSVGEVTLSTTGTTLASVSIPSGTYGRVEFDIAPNCPSGKSVQLTNANGSFTTTDSISIRFDGSFTANPNGSTLTLLIQSIITQLNFVASSADIKTYAQAQGGDF